MVGEVDPEAVRGGLIEGIARHAVGSHSSDHLADQPLSLVTGHVNNLYT